MRKVIYFSTNIWKFSHHENQKNYEVKVFFYFFYLRKSHKKYCMIIIALMLGITKTCHV